MSGGTGTLAVRSSSPAVDVRYDNIARKAVLTARSLGTANVTVFDVSGDSASVAVLVAPAAGIVPSDIRLDFGGNVSPQFALARANAEIVRQAQMQPNVKIDVHGLSVASTLHPGDLLEAQARVKIDGQNVFVDALGTTNVHLRVAAYPQLDPQILLYSDDPERLDASADGVLYSGTIDAARPARAYVYHVSDTPNRRLYLALQSTGAAARVQMLGYSAGPENAFSYVGHRATLQYLLERGAQESEVVNIAADTPYLFPLSSRAMRAGDLVASIFDLRVLEGDALAVSVVAVSGDRGPVEVLAGPQIAGDGHGRRGEFSLAGVPPLGLSFTWGGPEPAPFPIGAPTIANLRPGGRPLGGDYGVLRGIALQLANPTTVAQNVYFYEAPAGGNATTTLWFTGDPAPTEIACVRIPTNRYAIKAFELAPGETRTVTGEYMTDGTSYFPLLFGLTATPPSPAPGTYSPDACTPKAPPSPSPSSLPAPPASPSAPSTQAPSVPQGASPPSQPPGSAPAPSAPAPSAAASASATP